MKDKSVLFSGGQTGSEHENSRDIFRLHHSATKWEKQESALVEQPLPHCNYTPVTLQIPWYSHMSNIDSESSIDSLSMDRTPPRNESLSTDDSDDSHLPLDMYLDQTSSDDNDWYSILLLMHQSEVTFYSLFSKAVLYQLCSCSGNRLWTTKRSHFTVMNDIRNDIVTFFNELWTGNGHNQGIMNDKRSQFSIMNDIENNKGHNILVFFHNTQSW